MASNSIMIQDARPAVLREARAILNRYFAGPVEIKAYAFLSGPTRRNAVVRLSLDKVQVILKQSLPDKTDDDDKEIFGRFGRDWAGLEFLNKLCRHQSPIAPLFYGGSEQYQFILFEDLGHPHISLVDYLMSSDRGAAISALERYMRCIGQLHARAYGHTNEYNKILQKINPGARQWPYYRREMIDNISRVLNKLKIILPTKTYEEINLVYESILDPGPFTTLIHGDICPDNVFDDPKTRQMKLIDFEWSFVRNALLDGTYLRMSNPTCWCVKKFPEEIIKPLEKIYREELAKKISAACSDDLYYEAYVSACAYWMLGLLAWELDKILDNENDISDPIYQSIHPQWRPEDSRSRPRHISRLEAFIKVSQELNKLSHLRELADKILKALRLRWQNPKPLELFPAFISNEAIE